MKINEVISPNRPTLHVPIAPSGAGKTTLLRRLQAQNPDIQVFSLDTLRHEWYDPNDYEKAWKAASEDPEFMNKANQRFMELIKTQKDLFIDNTNLTPKRRRFYLDYARRHGYKTVGYLLPANLETLIARQSTRTDKSVPADAVRQQYASLQPPATGEFDDVVTVGDEDKQHAQPQQVS
jgi:predicted kinase